MNAVTPEMIAEWKKQYVFVFKVNIDGTDIYFRTVTREDYLQIAEKQALDMANFDYEMETVKMCVLAGLDEETLKRKSGLIPVLAEQIMLKSGYQQVEAEEL